MACARCHRLVLVPVIVAGKGYGGACARKVQALLEDTPDLLRQRRPAARKPRARKAGPQCDLWAAVPGAAG